MYSQPMARGGDGQKPKKLAMILAVDENILACISSRQNMIKNAGTLKAKRS